MAGGWRKYRFLLALLVSALPVQGYLLGNNYLGLIVGLPVIALLDFLLGKDYHNPNAEDLATLEEVRFYRWILYAYVPIHLGLIIWGALVISRDELSPWQTLGLMLSIGFVTGAQGITVAHELGHKKSKAEQILAKLLLTTVCYGHFFIEHNRGHHVRVSTREDPASARYRESFYAFYPRTVIGSYLNAWRLEAARLSQHRFAFTSWHNQMLWFAAIPLGILLVFWLALGPLAAVFFLVQSIMAFTLLELVNYIEHYGLVRKKLDAGRHERVTHQHSWNATDTLTNCFLIHLQRHSDHHANPSRRYQALMHYDDSPQLPTGYSGMVLLALVPPLWFAVMNPRVEAFYGSRGIAT